MTEVKSPPITILPAASIPIERTRAFGPVPSALKLVSIVPSGFKRATPDEAAPLTVLKSPLNNTRPRASIATERTAPLAPPGGANVGSTLPFTFSRAMRLRGMPFTEVKSPAMTTLPSDGWMTTP